MPVIEIHLIDGYDDAVKARLGRALTDAVRSVIPTDPDAVTVLTHELSIGGYMRGGQSRTPTPALPDPINIVQDFLSVMEARELDAAAGHLAEGFEMTFPGDARMTDLSELINWAASRYRSVTKHGVTYDAGIAAGDPVVFCHGTLAGEWLDGTPFADIRLVDRFTLRDSKIWRQQVWNDIAEVRP